MVRWSICLARRRVAAHAAVSGSPAEPKQQFVAADQAGRGPGGHSRADRPAGPAWATFAARVATMPKARSQRASAGTAATPTTAAAVETRIARSAALTGPSQAHLRRAARSPAKRRPGRTAARRNRARPGESASARFIASCTPRYSAHRCLLVLPEDASIGLAPHRDSRAASSRSLPGLAPAVIRPGEERGYCWRPGRGWGGWLG